MTATAQDAFPFLPRPMPAEPSKVVAEARRDGEKACNKEELASMIR